MPNLAPASEPPVDPSHPRRLSRAREFELVAAAGAGDTAACGELVEAFMPAIAGMARRYSTSTDLRDELMQEGVVGLLRAVRRYDPRMETPFWAYASCWVRQAMQQLVAELTRPVVLSDRALRYLARIRDARRKLQQAKGGEPSTHDLAAATGLARAQVESLVAADGAVRRLDGSLDGDEGAGRPLGESLADPFAQDQYERVLEQIEAQEVRNLSEQLDERERGIVCSHYGLVGPIKTLRQIADGLGLSVERVRQLEERALSRLRQAVAAS